MMRVSFRSNVTPAKRRLSPFQGRLTETWEKPGLQPDCQTVVTRCRYELQTFCKEVTTMENQKVATIAKKLGVSTQAVYKKLAKVGDRVATELVKENGVTWLTPKGVEILEEAFGNKHQPEVSIVDNLVATLQKGIDEKQAMIISQQEMIRQLLEKQAEERHRTDTIIMKLAHDLEDTRRSALAIEEKINSLAYKPEPEIMEILNRPTPQVQIWQPPASKPDPLEGLGPIKRAWVKLVHPEMMRRNAA